MNQHRLTRRTLLAAGAALSVAAPRPAAALMGATVRRITVEGATLAYLRSGQGPALVLLHGIGGRKEDWLRLLIAIAPQRTVLALDLPGFGASSRDAPSLSVPAQAEAVAAILDHEGVAAADLVGHALGGWIAASFAARHPTRTRRLVLVDPAGAAAMAAAEPPVKLFPETLAEMRAWLAHVRHAESARTEAFAVRALETLDASGERSLAPRLLAALQGSPRLEAVMPAIRAPTLVIWGAEDRLFPATLAPAIAALTPGAETALIPAASHFPHLDQPDAFNALATRFILG